MADYCLQNATQAEFDDLMVLTGLGARVEDGAGTEMVIPAAFDVAFDRIGPITMNGKTYPDYYVNLRVGFALDDAQKAALAPFTIVPPQPQYRVWA